MKKLIIFCDGGLGNRLGVLIGGYLFAERFKREIIIAWPENTWCGCSFNDLFQNEYEITNSNINEVFSKNINNKFLIHENQTNFKINSYYPNFNTYKEFENNNDRVLVYYHNSIPDFFGQTDILRILEKFKIKNILKNKVNEFCKIKNIDNKTFGIHFRKTDFGNFLNEDAIFNDLLLNSDKRFFICSDSEETENKFKNLKNVSIFVKKYYVEKLKDGDWNDLIQDNEGRKFNFNVKRSKQSVIESFIDLLILSKTKIITESHSTFLKFAKLYSNIKI
jgi:hypothetical protein